MCVGKQERSVIDNCLQKLDSLMVTFRTYGGRQIDVNRGDFDINFFRGLNDTCSDIYNRLLSLLHGASQDNKKTSKVGWDEEVVLAKAVEVPFIEQDVRDVD